MNSARDLEGGVREQPGMEEDDEQDGDPSEPLDVGAEIVLFAGGGRPSRVRLLHPLSFCLILVKRDATELTGRP